MWQRALWLASISVTACYLGSDKHEVDDVTLSDASVGDSGSVRRLDGALDATTAVDASDATVDAGCQSDLECPLASPQCSHGDCVPCSQQNDCARFADTPNCGPSGACVVCTADHAQLCSGSTPACDPTTNACVQCVADSDCPSPTQAGCNTMTHTCEACTEDSQCTRFGDVCETKTGACVACRPETEATDCRTDKSCTGQNCAGTACNPKTLTCGTVPRGSVTTCSPCASDSECVTDNRCIDMTFGPSMQDLGGFCLKQLSSGCVRGYANQPIMRASLSGAASDTYCGVDESSNSCAAVLLAKMSKACTNDESCGAPGARCETVNGLANTCTYSCAAAADCVITSQQCGGPAGQEYCGAN